MEHEVKKYIEEIDSYIAELTHLSASAISNMDEDEFKQIKLAFNLLDKSKEMVLMQARMIDESNRKLDLILASLERLEDKKES